MNTMHSRWRRLLAGTALTLLLFGPASLLQAGEIQDPIPVIPYEAGRGLITTEGPSGMFINPTSATLPQNAFTAQWCSFFPNDNTSVVGHGYLVSYGITDWLEVGGIGNYVDLPGGNTLTTGGPMARIRLLKDEGLLPQLSIGYYGKYGDIDQSNAFGAVYKRLPLFGESWIVKSLGIHAGMRSKWLESADADLRGYGGVEIQLPYRLYAVGEITTQDSDPHVPFAYGLQWRAGWINISAAMLQPGGLPDPSLYLGIGTGLEF